MAEQLQLPDRLVLIVACCVALAGLVALILVAPDQDEQRYVLKGTVLEHHGSKALVCANVTVVGKNLSGNIEREVFWNGNEFIALAQER